MSTAILTPFDRGRVVELGRKTFRKQILPVGTINYKGRRIDFTRGYHEALLQAYRDGAFDMVPAQMADHANRHTDDPFRLRGEVKGMELADDGVYATFELDDDAAQLVKEHPDVGVSARIVEDYTRADGKHFPRAIGQVLLTLDPRLPGMKPWEAVELSQDTENQIDLSREEWNSMAKVKADEIEGLQDAITAAVRAAMAEGDKPHQDDEPDDAYGDEPDDEPELDGDEELSDEEIAQLAALLAGDDESDAEETDEADEPIAASNDDRDGVIEMARAEAQQAREQVAKLHADIAAEKFKARKRDLLEKGVTPAAIELARPFLETHAPHVIELSNGKSADATEAVGQLLDLIATGRASVELGNERGHSFGGDGDETERELERMNGEFDERFGR